ncbi:hypothetical protein [Streptosporangium amethystogenes]|uniref:hypothetical protein n=1 Tax=Streptosporangium amethystogenes TaxID=2002 RepID=UPI0012FBDCCA|nr:hypothetical protein [Streptosporangium amethystogenes]
MDLSQARISGSLNLHDAILSAPGGRALTARQLQTRELDLRPRRTPEGEVDLRHAQIGVIRDDPATWSPRRQDGLGAEHDQHTGRRQCAARGESGPAGRPARRAGGAGARVDPPQPDR